MNYTVEDGLQSNEFNTGAAFKNRKGEMYFGGVNGFNVFIPDSIRANLIIPQVHITAFFVLDNPFAAEGELFNGREFELKHWQSTISFEYVALNYTNPRRNRYQYKMEGVDEEWVEAGTRRFVRHTNLGPGEYIFRVRGSNNDDVWNNEGAFVRIIVVPPFWKTWWFLIVAGSVLLGAMGGTIRAIELRKIRRRIEMLENERAIERERTRISQDMHDEVGSSLTKIAILSELAQRSIEDRPRVETELKRISENARTVIDSISEIVWAIDPRHDALEDLASYVRRYASEFFESANIKCRFDFPERVEALKLTPETRRTVFLTAKEAMNNIVKHSHATEVMVALRMDEKSFELKISDNGHGFDMSAFASIGHGLTNMRKRINQAGGECEIESRPGTGTTVGIRFSL